MSHNDDKVQYIDGHRVMTITITLSSWEHDDNRHILDHVAKGASPLYGVCDDTNVIITTNDGLVITLDDDNLDIDFDDMEFIPWKVLKNSRIDHLKL